MTLTQKFKSAIKRGTGEAFLLIKKNPQIDFSKYIIYGALNNLSYDNQMEGSRARYIYKLYLLSKSKEKIRSAILTGLANESKIPGL